MNILFDKEILNKNLGILNSTLRELLIDSKLISIQTWNDKIAPELSSLAQSIDGSTITARTFKLPENYFE